MSENLLNDLAKFKNAYYKDNKKSLLFNKSQKHDYAQNVTSRFDINNLLQKTVYIIKGTNKLFINYPVYKQYAHPDNYELFVNYVHNLIPFIIDKYVTFECHVNLHSFTVTAAARHKEVIRIFCSKCFDISYTGCLNHIYIYNTPSTLDIISGMLLHLVDPETRKKIVLVNKHDSIEPVSNFIQNGSINAS
jgi:hypothetical protein